MTLLENFVTVSPYMHKMVSCFEDDFTLGITDTDRFIAYIPGKKLQFGISPCDPIKAGSLANITMTQGKAVSKVMDSSVYGIAYIAGGIPIVEEVSARSMVMQHSAEDLAAHSEKQHHVMTEMVRQVQTTFSVPENTGEALPSSQAKCAASLPCPAIWPNRSLRTCLCCKTK